MAGLLDFFTSPNAALAAGLLSPQKGDAFGPALLQGIKGAQGVTAANSIDQLRQLEAQMREAQLNPPPAPPPIANVNPSNFTPASVQRFAQTGNYNDLAQVPKTPMVELSIDQRQQRVDKAADAAAIAYAKPIGERAADRARDALATGKSDADMERIALALSRGAQTGFGQSTLLDIQSGLAGLGLQIGDVTQMGEKQVIRAIGSELALWMRNPDSGFGLTGNTSNRDLTFLQGSQAGLGQSVEGNLKIIELTKRRNKMKRDISTFQNAIIAANQGVPPLSLDTKIIEFINDYQFLNKGEREEIEALSNKREETGLTPTIISIE